MCVCVWFRVFFGKEREKGQPQWLQPTKKKWKSKKKKEKPLKLLCAFLCLWFFVFEKTRSWNWSRRYTKRDNLNEERRTRRTTHPYIYISFKQPPQKKKKIKNPISSHSLFMGVLTAHEHGKSRVRLGRTWRDASTRAHYFVEWEVAVRLISPAMDKAYTDGDNSGMTTTDTTRNMVR